MIEIEEICPGCGSSECKVVVGINCQSCDMDYYDFFAADGLDIPNHSEALDSIKRRLDYVMLVLEDTKNNSFDKIKNLISCQGAIRACLEVIENTKEKL